MLTPDTAATQPATKPLCSMYVAQDAIAIDGTAPDVGEEVEVTLKARVAAVEGNAIRLEATSVNGSPLIDEESGPGEPDGDEAMMDMAKKADAEGGMGY